MEHRPHDLPDDRGELETFVHWSVIRAARGLEHRLGRALAPLGLTPVQFGALAHLAVESSLTQAQLADRVLVRPQSASHLLSVLTDRGLVERTGERGSGRPNPVRLTAQGRDLLTRAWPVVTAADTPEALGLDETGRRQLLAAVTAVLEQPENAPGPPVR